MFRYPIKAVVCRLLSGRAWSGLWLAWVCVVLCAAPRVADAAKAGTDTGTDSGLSDSGDTGTDTGPASEDPPEDTDAEDPPEDTEDEAVDTEDDTVSTPTVTSSWPSAAGLSGETGGFGCAVATLRPQGLAVGLLGLLLIGWRRERR